MKNLLADDHSQLDALAEKLFDAFEAGDLREIFATLDLIWARLAMHIRAEHLHLFPALLQSVETRQTAKEISLKQIESRIAQLKSDHDFFMRELAGAVKQMREIETNDSAELSAVREKISDVFRRLKTHNEIEESEVYPWTEIFLDAEKQVRLDEQMRTELENLPPRFGKSGGGQIY